MTLEAVGASFFLVIVTLPMVNKVSKAATLLYLLFFARMVYRQRDFFLPSVHKVFLIFLSVLIFISALFNTISLEHFKRAMYLAIFILVYYATVYFLQKRMISIKVLVYSVFFAMTLYLLDGYMQFFNGTDMLLHEGLQNGGVCSISRNRNIFAFAMLFYIAVLTYLTIEKNKRYGILLFFAMGLMVLTLSRQIWIASLLFFVVIFWYRFKATPWWFWFVGVGAVTLLVWLLWQIPEVHQRIMLIEHGYSSGRIDLWRHMLAQVTDSLLLGHSFRSPLIISGVNIHYVFAHNIEIGILYNLGVSGLAFYFVFLIYFLKILIKCKNEQYKPYFLALFLAIFMVQQQLGGSMLIHKFIGPAVFIFLAYVTAYCSETLFTKKVYHNDFRPD
jgi:hypothetical protein